ncbi:MAG: ArsR/SmtB family transcription factor, partial [bacterium]
MNSRHARAQDLLAALAPPKRFELVALLARGRDLSVSGLAGEVGLSQSCTTRHLQALERAGLVRGVRDGKRVVFHLRPSDPTATSVLAALLPQVATTAPADEPRSAGRAARVRLSATGPSASRTPRTVAAPASEAAASGAAGSGA